MNKKKYLFIGVIVLFFVVALFGVYFVFNNGTKDNEKFAKEYDMTTENVFVYRTGEEIVKILKNGTGVVYLGFPECPWCRAYVKILNEVANEEEIEKIYYFNILDDRKNNTELYKEIVSLLNDKLLYDEEGNKRIYVPDVSFVLEGEIIGHDNETSVISGDITPDMYWTDEKKIQLKEKLRNYLISVSEGVCTSCDL